MSSPMQAPPDGDQNRGPALTAIFWTECAFAMAIMTLRLYARLKIRALGADDWMMLLTVVIFIITTCFVTYLASIGGFRHVYYLTLPQTLQAVKFNWITQVFGVMQFATGKISVALFILRLIGPNIFWRKWLLYFIMVTTFIVNALTCIIIFVQCDPPRSLWEPEIPHTCWDPSVQTDYNYFQGSWNIFVDISLALIPATILWKLNMDVTKRVSLSILMGLGFIAAIFGGIKVKYLITLASRADFTWITYNIFAWSGSEAFVVISCGSAPTLKPLWDQFHNGNTSTGHTPLKRDPSYAMKYPYTRHNRVDSQEESMTGQSTIKATTDTEVASARNGADSFV